MILGWQKIKVRNTPASRNHVVWSRNARGWQRELHMLDHDVTKARARHLGRAFHQSSKVIGHFFGCDGFFH